MQDVTPEALEEPSETGTSGHCRDRSDEVLSAADHRPQRTARLPDGLSMRLGGANSPSEGELLVRAAVRPQPFRLLGVRTTSLYRSGPSEPPRA